MDMELLAVIGLVIGFGYVVSMGLINSVRRFF